MDKVSVEIITGEGILYSGEADMVLAPGVKGQLGIGAHHAPLITALEIGELKVRKDGEEEYFAVHGGFMEVRSGKVTVLVDVAERAGEIDVERAEAARARAESLLKEDPTAYLPNVQGALRRSMIRIRVARRRRRRRRESPPSTMGGGGLPQGQPR